MTMTKENIITELQDYMFTSDNLGRFTKHMIQINLKPKQSQHLTIYTKIDKNADKNVDKNADKNVEKNADKNVDKNVDKNADKNVDKNADKNADKNVDKIKFDKLVKKKSFSENDKIYKPKQKDSLFWCFYILKNGYSNYEMEINNQYFVVEKNEKFKYIEIIRKNKDILKIHKIKPLTELEDDLANKDKISVKTFFALCVLENINVLLVDNRKIFELICVDIDDKHPVNIIHRNSKTYENHIELNVTNEVLQKYRETYYNINSFDANLKAMGSYKLDELIDLCKKLNINIEINEDKKKKTKKDIYELLVLNY